MFICRGAGVKVREGEVHESPHTPPPFGTATEQYILNLTDIINKPWNSYSSNFVDIAFSMMIASYGSK